MQPIFAVTNISHAPRRDMQVSENSVNPESRISITRTGATTHSSCSSRSHDVFDFPPAVHVKAAGHSILDLTDENGALAHHPCRTHCRTGSYVLFSGAHRVMGDTQLIPVVW